MVEQNSSLGDRRYVCRIHQTVQSQRRIETRIYTDAAAPKLIFRVIKWIIRHHDASDLGDVKDVVKMLGDISRTEKCTRLLQVRGTRVEAEDVKHRDDSLCRFRRWCVVHEQRLPDEISLLLFRHGPELCVRYARRAQSFCSHVVIGQQVIDAPQAQFLELSRKQM